MWLRLSNGYMPLKSSIPTERRPPWKRSVMIITVINVGLLIVSLCLLVASYGYYHGLWKLNAHLRRTSTWSPVYDMIDLRPHVKTINGTLFPPQEPSIARQPPNPKADELWEEYELLRVMPVNRNSIVKLGKDPETAVKLEDEIWGLGDDAYAAVFDVYHQIHCLNALRKIAYGQYYNVSQGRTNIFKTREMHINHCADILLQALTCSGNVNLITLHWVETQNNPWPDMSVDRQCIDFDRLTEFRTEVSLDMDKYKYVMNKPLGVTQLHMPDQYYAYFGRENPNHVNGVNQDDDFIL
ncbi:uncharacterized protein JN550_004350 [Neoarthrinium moseri]|uniref:uncharacterized protein n=1 Tax=Neoarthrinium moseri TaxID=1658444 RepID=UPI001FDBD9D1|nr:uncharacterized protein JN550_004350 [Neoarthrinium moseri]KAI1872147.1 hypothetical protein JN550_004350 [Neoarthrinium moseri]